MSQVSGHLDFFPNGGVHMPGCQKNILSQIVDIEGIWEGKTIVRRDFSWGGSLCSVLLNFLNVLVSYRSHIFYNNILFNCVPKIRAFHWGKWA